MRAAVTIVGTGRDTEVILDGVPVAAGIINGITMRATPGAPPVLELRFVVTRRAGLELADADVVVESATAAVLRKLGWTPPEPADNVETG